MTELNLARPRRIRGDASASAGLGAGDPATAQLHASDAAAAGLRAGPRAAAQLRAGDAVAAGLRAGPRPTAWHRAGGAAVAAAVLASSMAAAQTPSGAEEGKELFLARCGMCHLRGGTGTFMLGRRLGPENALLAERTNLDATYVKHVVRSGIVSMPRITRAEVSDAELQAIVAYLVRKGGPVRKDVAAKPDSESKRGMQRRGPPEPASESK